MFSPKGLERLIVIVNTFTDYYHSVGGGGKTQERKEKIKEKNVRLNDQRARRIQEEEKAKWEKKVAKGDAALDESGIHPSRRRLVPGT